MIGSSASVSRIGSSFIPAMTPATASASSARIVRFVAGVA